VTSSTVCDVTFELARHEFQRTFYVSRDLRLLIWSLVYRGLNEVTRKDAYPLPRVDDTLDELKDASFNTHLDLASGFWQV
jgi:hypothetical protein